MKLTARQAKEPIGVEEEVEGVRDSCIDQLKLIAAAATRVTRGELKQRTLLSSWNEVIDYCRTSMAFAD